MNLLLNKFPELNACEQIMVAHYERIQNKKNFPKRLATTKKIKRKQTFNKHHKFIDFRPKIKTKIEKSFKIIIS